VIFQYPKFGSGAVQRPVAFPQTVCPSLKRRLTIDVTARVTRKPYKPVAVSLPQPYNDPSFEAFRKELGEIASHKDRAALAGYALPPSPHPRTFLILIVARFRIASPGMFPNC
jgi:hypothetical protein